MDNAVKLALVEQTPKETHFTIQDKTYGERHFVLKGNNYEEATKEAPQPVRIHSDRAYVMQDAASFIAAVSQYGNKGQGVVFFDDKGIKMFFDHASRKETITLPFIKSLELRSILGVNGDGLDWSQKGFVKILETFPECFENVVTLLANAQRFEASTAIEVVCDVDPDNIIFTYQEKSGKQTARFPKKLIVSLPYFEGSKNIQRVECDFEVVVPKSAEEKPRFKIINTRKDRAERDAIHIEVVSIKVALPDWLFLFGK